MIVFIEIMSWDCQGAASNGFMTVLKNFVKHNKPKIIVLLEPRISGVQPDRVCERTVFDSWVRVEPISFSDGIWIFWRNSIGVDVLYTHPQFLVVRVSDGLVDPWILILAYSSPDYGFKRHLWVDLNSNTLNIEGPRMVVRDFNSMFLVEEVSLSKSWSCHRSVGFQEWIFE